MRVEPLGCHTINTSLSNSQRTSAKQLKTTTQLLNSLDIRSDDDVGGGGDGGVGGGGGGDSLYC